MNVFLDVLRLVVFATFVFSSAVALGSWAVRARRLNPFSRSGQIIRRLSDPVLSPIETWLVRRGGNPHQAGIWLVGISVVGGILVVTVIQWLVVQAAGIAQVSVSGPRAIARTLVYYASQLVLLALIVRVIGSWFGKGQFTPWMRPFYVLTDWIVRPLRRIIPPIGMIDITPLVAWFLILVIRPLVLGLL